MSEFNCNECQRNFVSQEALEQHNTDKHGIGGTQSKHEMRQLNKHEKENQEELNRKNNARSKLIKRSAYIAIPVFFIVIVSVFILSQPQSTANSININSAADIPKTPIHWHPTLTILINGQQKTIPADLGLIGAHQPIHTHDATGTLHYENNNPTPENMPLRYFFEKVWRKQFNSKCIFDNCNGDSGTVKMYVNGNENLEFENYIPKDKDDIRIEFG